MERWMMMGALGLLLAAGTAVAEGQEPAAPPVRAIKVLPDKAPDCTTLKTMVESVTRDCKNNDERMIALNNFMRISHYHRAYPPGGPSLKWFTCYGWSLCGGLAGLQESLYAQMPGWSWRGVHVPGHNMSEAKYDGTWHWVDAFTKFYCWRPETNAIGRTIACHYDIRDNPGLVTNNLEYVDSEKVVYARDNRKGVIDGKVNWAAPPLLVCGDALQYCLYLKHTGIDPECNTPDKSWSPEAYSAEVNLLPGFSLENTWDPLATPEESWPIKDNNPVGHGCGNKDLRNDPAAGPIWEPYFQRVRSYWNGRLVFAPVFNSPEILKSFAAVQNVKVDGGALVPDDAAKPASVTVNLESPYVIVKINGTVAGDDVSVAGVKLENGAFSTLVPGYSQTKQQVKIDIKKSLKALQLEAILLNNAGVLPYLSPGPNKVTVSVADPKALGDSKLVVTYAYAPGCRDKSFEDLVKEGRRLCCQAYAAWATNAPVVVQKVYAAGDLPATIELDVPTPKDKFPVYPRMFFVRREIVPPGGKPLPLPENGVAPSRDGELKTLPNPFLIGFDLPSRK